MPQLNPIDWAPQLIWLAITFGILYVLMKRVALPRIGGVIEMRAARIASDLENADRSRRATQEAIAAYEQALAEAKARAHALAQAGRNALNEELAAERAELDRVLAASAAEAEARIQAAKASALKEVNAVAVEAAGAIVRRLIGVAPSARELATAVESARKARP
jgi:F-type H+-transporting ATPase subunit b